MSSNRGMTKVASKTNETMSEAVFSTSAVAGAVHVLSLSSINLISTSTASYFAPMAGVFAGSFASLSKLGFYKPSLNMDSMRDSLSAVGTYKILSALAKQFVFVGDEAASDMSAAVLVMSAAILAKRYGSNQDSVVDSSRKISM